MRLSRQRLESVERRLRSEEAEVSKIMSEIQNMGLQCNFFFSLVTICCEDGSTMEQSVSSPRLKRGIWKLLTNKQSLVSKRRRNKIIDPLNGRHDVSYSNVSSVASIIKFKHPEQW